MGDLLDLETDGEAPSKIEDTGKDDRKQHAKFPWVVEEIFRQNVLLFAGLSFKVLRITSTAWLRCSQTPTVMQAKGSDRSSI